MLPAVSFVENPDDVMLLFHGQIEIIPPWLLLSEACGQFPAFENGIVGDYW